MSAPDTDVVTAKWKDERIATLAWIKNGEGRSMAGTVFGEKENRAWELCRI
jgi:hypothetical protein